MFSSIVSGLSALLSAISTALRMVQQNKDQQAGAVAQQAADNAGVLKDVQVAQKAAEAVDVGGRAAANRVLLDDARSE